ncbi:MULTISPECIES: hypothetical protein [Pantoea]|uniref:hypothetical protein n=1 Tax=Pantoea TaxID=53335 RepID=UPI0013DDCD55|nr:MULTISPECIES: hypothetical protein [Pantoea]MCW0309093.1 hypothetical protein [Pantoea ananatis]MCW0340990.1 hypothetical protein [Pantoea ananatis]MCW0359359.1 hypothetical protein [Pantoea ananatis]MCW0363959.1 hypothetical protein [Pantoea ananatis]MCW1776448.1 hypothetical protein [Pantoea ananatis]
MNKSIRSIYEDTTVKLDNTAFEDCTFKNCLLIYAGTTGLSLTGCKIINCNWKLEGPASNTIMFLKSMYKDMGPFGKQMVEATFENIKK